MHHNARSVCARTRQSRLVFGGMQSGTVCSRRALAWGGIARCLVPHPSYRMLSPPSVGARAGSAAWYAQWLEYSCDEPPLSAAPRSESVLDLKEHVSICYVIEPRHVIANTDPTFGANTKTDPSDTSEVELRRGQATCRSCNSCACVPIILASSGMRCSTPRLQGSVACLKNSLPWNEIPYTHPLCRDLRAKPTFLRLGPRRPPPCACLLTPLILWVGCRCERSRLS